MSIEGVLTRQKCAEKWCATFWDPVPPDLVALNSQIFISGFSTFSESPFIIKWSLDLQMGPRILPKSQGLLVEGAFGENPF